MPVARRGRLCPVCLRPVKDGGCAEHGPWGPHQLATADDRRAAARASWQPFEPLLHACPRCLGEVAEGRRGFECVSHASARDAHGPFLVDELLGRERPARGGREPRAAWPGGRTCNAGSGRSGPCSLCPTPPACGG